MMVDSVASATKRISSPMSVFLKLSVYEAAKASALRQEPKATAASWQPALRAELLIAVAV